MDELIEPDGYLQFSDEMIESAKNIWQWKDIDGSISFPFILFKTSFFDKVYFNIKHDEVIVMDKEGNKKLITKI